MTLRESILSLLDERGPLTSNALAKILKHNRSTLRKLLLIMERKGLVTCREQKRRGVLYKLWQIR